MSLGVSYSMPTCSFGTPGYREAGRPTIVLRRNSWLLPYTFTLSHSPAYPGTPHGALHPVLHTRRCTGQASLWQALEQKRP